MKHMTTFLLTLAAVYVTLLVLMFIVQRQLMYFPDRHIGSPAQHGLHNFIDARAVASDGVKLQLWYHEAAPGFPTIVYFHGNAGNIGGRAGIYGPMAKKGFGVLALSYRGYGRSGGTPTEDGIYRDARAAIDYAQKDLKIPPERLLLYGESLGSGVAVQMATEYKVGGVVLEAPYLSVAQRAAEIYYYIPVKLLIHDKFDSLGKITRVSAPLLLFHGERDQVIPVAHGRRLLETATCVKKGFFFPEIGHNDFDRDAISSHVLDFAKEHRLIP